jgi:hypothetical protein
MMCDPGMPASVNMEEGMNGAPITYGRRHLTKDGLSWSEGGR